MYNVDPEHIFLEIREPCTCCGNTIFYWDGFDGVFLCDKCLEPEQDLNEEQDIWCSGEWPR